MNGKIIIAAAALALASGCASTGTSVSVPDKLKPAANETLSHEVPATGVQIYECSAAKDGFEWAFKGPEADLFDRSRNKIGKHYGGPTWESNDGSKIVGAVKAREDAPEANAIPWLLLGAKSTGSAGSFARVTSIQRVATTGGVAPAGGCGKGDVGKVARVPYTATYYFFSPK